MMLSVVHLLCIAATYLIHELFCSSVTLAATNGLCCRHHRHHYEQNSYCHHSHRRRRRRLLISVGTFDVLFFWAFLSVFFCRSILYIVLFWTLALFRLEQISSVHRVRFNAMVFLFLWVTRDHSYQPVFVRRNRFVVLAKKFFSFKFWLWRR